jgi:capsular polysaccharide biosynthesis protein
MLDRLSNENYATVVREHLVTIAPALQRIDGAIADAGGDRVALEVLRTMRIYLVSGLFDADYYRRTNPDLREPDLDLLEHFVRHGEKEGRRPNQVFWPWFFRDDIVVLPPCEFEAAGRDDRHALMRVKRMLTERLGLHEAFACYRRMLGLDDREQISLKRIGSLREAAEVQRGAFFEAAAAGEPFRVAAPNVLGEGNHRAIDGIARSIFVACLIDARVRGGSGVIETGAVALLDYQEFETARAGDQLDFDPAVFQAADDAAWIIVAGDEADEIELDEAFLLVGPRTDGFGHWLWEYLPKYLAAVHAHALPPVPILIDADMPSTHHQALELMLPEGVAIVELPAFAPARVRRLWCAPSQMYMPVLRERSRQFRWDCLAAPPERYAAIIGEMARRIDRGSPAPGGTGKVFLARRHFRHRRLFNEPAIEAAAAERGFRIVEPEELDFAAQVRLVREARFIIGADGPALFLAFFARPGTRLCILCHPDTAGLAVLTGPLGEIGIEVTVLTGPYIRIGDEHRDGSLYQIDEDGFRAFLEVWGKSAVVNGRSPTGPVRQLRPAGPKKRGAPRIAAFVGVKDEVEIVARIIDHNRAIGFDLTVFCDANSTDGTFEIIERYRSDGDIRIMQIQDPDHPDFYFPAALEMMKREEIGWVVSLDADEYCIPASGNVKDCASLENGDLLLLDRFNIPLSPSGPMMPERLDPDHYGDLLLIAKPIANLPIYLRQHANTPWIIGVDAPKAMARPERTSTVREGGHDIIAADRAPLRWSRPADLFIAHLPLTTRTRFVRKIDNARRFLDAHDAAGEGYLTADSAWHWRRWIALAEEGRLDEEFDRSIFDPAMIAELRRAGVIRSAGEIFGRNDRQRSR